MKKKLLLFVLLFAGLMSVKAADGTVTITNVRNAVPGYKGTLEVSLTGTDVQYANFQFNITLPEGITYESWSYGEMIPELNPPYNIVVTDQGSNTWQFLGYAGSTTPLTALNGVLLKLKFSVDAGTSIGTKNGSLSTIRLTEANSTTHSPEDANFSMEITDVVTLSEDETAAPAAITGVKVNVDRTLESGKWNTICLPFPMTEAQVDAAFGSDVQIGDFNGYETDDADNIKVKFTKATAIEANHPYIIKVSSTVNGFGVTDATVDINPADDEKGRGVNKGTSWKAKYIMAMIGVYEPTTLDEDWLYIKDNKFKYSTGKSKLLPYRAYFSFCDFDSSVQTTAAPRIHISYDEISTGIKVVSEKKAEDNQYYNLQGCKVSNPTKGLYIVNGKKVIVK